MLRIEGLSFSYQTGTSRVPVFDDLSVDFARGMNVILGPNGAGKSTLLKSVFGLLKYRGSVHFGDRNITGMRPDERTELMSYLPQMDIDVSRLTVFEMVLLGRLPELRQRVGNEDLLAIMDALAALNITDLARRPFIWDIARKTPLPA